MVLVHHAGKFVRPANYLYWVTICGRVNIAPEFIIATDRDGEIQIKFREHTHQFCRATLRGIDHVQNSPAGIGGRQWPIFSEIRKLRTDRKSKYSDLFGRDATVPHHARALLVCNEEIICRASVPGCVDSDRVRDNHHTFANSVGSQNLLEHIGVGGKRADDDVRLKTVEHGSKLRLQPNQSPKFRVVICLAIEPPIDESPGTWRRIHQRQIASAHQFVDRPVGFGKQIPQFHCSLIQSDTSQPFADSSCGAIVALSETGGQDQYSLFHWSSGNTGYKGKHTRRVLTRESIRTLMDICARQSKLLRR